MDGTIDIYLIGDDGQPLSKRKRSAIIKKFPVRFVELTDEAWAQTKDKDLVVRSLPLLGIKKKRKLTPEAKKGLKQRLEVLLPDTRPSLPTPERDNAEQKQLGELKSE